ncbi:propionyl-CoA carboxylase alpha chain [Pimephales promelas]|nr:propionyl-CoA carboxylase alpha chain [Pimephales promelas]
MWLGWLPHRYQRGPTASGCASGGCCRWPLDSTLTTGRQLSSAQIEIEKEGEREKANTGLKRKQEIERSYGPEVGLGGGWVDKAVALLLLIMSLACPMACWGDRDGPQADTLPCSSEPRMDPINLHYMTDRQQGFDPKNNKIGNTVETKTPISWMPLSVEGIGPSYGKGVAALPQGQQYLQAAEGVTFIGPDTHATQTMGDKIRGKLIAKMPRTVSCPHARGLVKQQSQ